ncbi:MAG: hypothetical protein GYB65_11545 [Chloroflexi bacterium]|nr:hypothetical protein [Chloroflexota bacterium]
MMSTYQNLTLAEWLAIGQQSGAIQDIRTIALAVSISEFEAMAWIADLVMGRASEREAIAFMRRALENSQQPL